MVAATNRPDWSRWLNLRTVKIDDAIALSLNIAPKSIQQQSILTPLRFPSKQIQAEYEKRLAIAVDHLGIEEFFRSQGMTSRQNPLRSRPIFLTDFVKLATHCKWPLPSELKALADMPDEEEQPRPPPEALQKVGARDTAAGGNDWQTKCREIADELHAKDIAAGAWSSVSDIVNRVAPIADERTIRGPNGKLTAGNILREALQGEKWNTGRNKR